MSNLCIFKWEFQKKRTSISKKRIRKNIWKRKGYWAALKAFSLGKCLSTGNSKSFCVGQKNSTTNAKGFLCDKEISNQKLK